MQDYFNGKTVLLTGGAGFIGSNLVNKLLKLGAKVIVVDNLLTGRFKNLAHLMDESFVSKVENFEFINADVSTQVESYFKLDTKIDLILHFASPASPPRYQEYPVETYLVNSIGTHHLLEFIKKHNPEARLIFASTSEIYGNPLVHPQVESYWGNVNPNGVRSCYDEAKRLGETICGVFYRNFGVDVRIVRIFNTYGPNMDPLDGRVIPNFILQGLKKLPISIYGKGDQTRSYCFVDDLVEYILRFSAKEGLNGQTINIGNDKEFTVLQTAQLVNQVLGNNADFNIEFAPLPADDPTKRKPDLSKAIELLDFNPSVDLQTGLKTTIEYFKNDL